MRRRRWFQGVYWRLVRVHGFRAKLRDHQPDDYTHLVWVRDDAQRKGLRLNQLFAALQTDRWVDAQDAVTDFALEYWKSLRQPSPWLERPDTFFAGRWGVNANLRVYRSFLNRSLPQSGGNWDVAGWTGL